jgi:threonylcarbamoyladenosine tRNA methylthiotransferase MtaB
MNICFITLGCRLNKAESCFWKMLLIKFGYNIVNSIRRANLSIINSCSVTNEASRKTNQTIKRLKKINRNIKIIITGCCVNINYDRLIQFKELNIILNNSKKKFLIKIILKNFPLNSKKKFKKIFYKFFLKIQDGCNNKCTFCVVRIARGKERSFSIKNIINKIKYFEQFGTKEIVLSGIHLGSYGKDLNNNLNLLINEMLEKTNISRIRLGSIEPWNITDRFLNLWKNKRMMPHLHLPLQSGSNSILKKMS